MCPHTTLYVSSYYYVCPRTPIYVSSYYYICVSVAADVRERKRYKHACEVGRSAFGEWPGTTASLTALKLLVYKALSY